MPRTNDWTGIRTAVIGQKGPLFVLEDEKDNRYYDWSVQPRQNRKISAQGRHRTARTGYTGQDERTAPLGQDVQLKHSDNYRFTKT